MRALLVVAGVAVFVVTGASIAQERAADGSLLELDHVLMIVERGGKKEQAALEKAGITFLANPAHHDGAGTSSRGALFANAYLELGWLDPQVKIDPSHPADMLERTSARAVWRKSGASPFAVGLRRRSGVPDALPIKARTYTAPWMRPGTSILTLGDEKSTDVPELFIVPRYMGLDAWVEDSRKKEPRAFEHKLGVHRLTDVSIVARGSVPPEIARALPQTVRVVAGADALLHLTFDVARRQRRVDLRPALPIVIAY